MAFGFFRRRQKMVMIIMAILMVSFLIGFQGMDLVFKRDQDPAVGRFGGQVIKTSDLRQAAADVSVLSIFRQSPILEDFQVLAHQNSRNRENDLNQAFAILLAEANKAGIRVTDSEISGAIKNLMESIGKKDDEQGFYSLLRDQGHNQRDLTAAMGHYLTIRKNYQANQTQVPPSVPELRQFYRQTREQINLEFVKVSASEFLAKAGEPKDMDVRALFQQYNARFDDAHSLGGAVSPDNPFGLGYKQAPRAQVQYMLIRQDVIQRVSRPSDDQVAKYFLDNKAKYDKQGKQLSDARKEILDTLVPGAAQARTDAVVTQVETRVNEQKGKIDPTFNVYENALDYMTEPAKDVLATPLKEVRLDGELQTVVAALARQADLDNIVYPYGLEGEISIDPKVHVSLEEKEITLGAALQKITEKVMGPQAQSRPSVLPTSAPATVPQIQWAMCKGFDRVLFPVGPGNLNQFPLKAGDTGLKDLLLLSQDPVVGMAGIERGPRLVQVVVASKPLLPPNTENPNGMEVGDTGPRMTSAMPPDNGTLLWRLAKVEGAKVPTLDDLNSNPELHLKVVKDWKDMQAYALALAQAQKLAAEAKEKGLEAVAKAQKLTTEKTDLFARSMAVSPQQEVYSQRMQQAYMSLLQSGKQFPQEEMRGIFEQLRMDALREAQMYEPLKLEVNQVASVQINSNSVLPRQQFIDAAFSLAPQNVEPPYTGKAPVGLAEIRVNREVLVMQRIDFRPVVAGEFQKAINGSVDQANPQPSLARLLEAQQQWEVQSSWFSLSRIAARTGYQKEEQKG